MWSNFLLCLLVGLSLALQESPAWKENTEYTYEVRGRSLSGLDEISKYYTGIVIRAKLLVQPQGTDLIRCKIAEPEYADVATELPGGWMSELPDSLLTYKRLEMTDKPFDVVLQNGVVRDLKVEKEVKEWEANIIKSFVSQFQLDTSAENVVHSRLNILPKEGSNSAVFKVLEDTVTGITENTYDIHPLPEYILQSQPYLAPFPHLKGDGSIIEIVKSKNYTEGRDLPSYYFGLGNAGTWKPQSNQFGQIIFRSSLGRAIVTGTLKRYTIQFSETINKIVVSCAAKQQEKGSVNSMMRMKLTNAEQQKSVLPQLSSPVSLGSLVYSYTQESNIVSPGKVFRREHYSQYDQHSSESEEKLSNFVQKRHPRSLGRLTEPESSVSSEESIESSEDWTQNKAKLNEAPKFPLLPFSTGYDGKSIKYAKGMQIVDKVYEIAQQIGQELMDVQAVPKKHTLARFVLLTSLLRIMNEQELRQAAERLYTQESDSPKYYSWISFRDALAETGTGPAFLVVQYLLENNKLQGYEASTVIVTMERANRQPTVEYVRAFFDLVKKQMTSHQEFQYMLNETMLFSFSRLVNKVFIDKRFSHREYPTHSFGKFDTKEGISFVRDEVIPYFSRQLTEAVKEADSIKIHAYIRALGYVADREIIYVFQPYLEGKIPISQFQRFLMVLALHDVARIEPKLVGPLLYRIYQNVGETTEIRVIAVYLLMYTNPSAAMLQRMAQYTNVEDNHRVSAAVKMSIESLTNMKGLEFAELRSAAESARPYLTKKYLAVQDPIAFIMSYASHSWESYYKSILHTTVSEESGVPTSFYLGLQGKTNGYQFTTFSLEGLISDIRNVFDVLRRQTKWYDEQKEEQTKSQQTDKSQWSSHMIARLLNLQTEELEQADGGLFVQLGEFRKHFLFNNHTIERLPHVLEEMMSTLEQGKTVRYTKLINNREAALAFPTEIGLPFLAVHDNPILMMIQGTLKGKTLPKLSDGDKLWTPDSAELQADVKITFSSKSHNEFGLFTPFNHYHYVAGYDENMQVYLPIKMEMNVDVKSKTIRLGLEPLESQNNVKIFHKSSWPYVSKHDILALKPTSERKDTHIIRRRIQHQWEHTFGERAVGMGFRVNYENDYKYTSFHHLIKGDLFQSNVQYEKLDVEYVPEKSQNKKILATFKYDMKHQDKYEKEPSGKIMLKKLFSLPQESHQRLSQLTTYAAAGIHNAEIHGYDATVEFLGQQNLKLYANLVYGKDYIHSKSRYIVYARKERQVPGYKPFEVAYYGRLNMVPMSGLDFEYVMKSDLKSTFDADFAFGEQPSEHQGEIHTVFSRSDSRKKYLMELPLYHKCQKEIQQGNKQLLACANMTQIAGLMDVIRMDIKYPNMRPTDLEHILEKYNGFSILQHNTFKIEENRKPKVKQGEIAVGIRYTPDLEMVNITVEDQGKYAYIKNIPLYSWFRSIAVVHPVFNIVDRLEGKLYGYKTYKPICVMDKTEAYSFDGFEYPLSLKPYWTVALQYVPLRSHDFSYSSVEEQLKQEIENYVVLVRQSSQNTNQKDVKIVVSSPRTSGRVLEVTVKPKTTGSYPQVFVDGTPVPFTEKEQSKTFHHQVTVSTLANGEIYVKVHDMFYVIYDGTRAKITTDSLALRNRIRGICGNFEGRVSDDFTTPKNCIVRDPREFIASYTVLKTGEQNQEIMDLKSRSQKSHCVYKKVPIYAKYISSRDEHEPTQQSNSCSRYQTRYVVENGRICFTLRPLTYCNSGCSKRGSVYKNIEVHCVENKNVATMWKQQIDKGASPDFSQKPVTKTMRIEVPQSCSSM